MVIQPPFFRRSYSTLLHKEFTSHTIKEIKTSVRQMPKWKIFYIAKMHFISNFQEKVREEPKKKRNEMAHTSCYLSVKMSLSCCSCYPAAFLHPVWPLCHFSEFVSLSLSRSLGEQRRQVPPVRAQLQRFQQRRGSVPHGQKNPIVHYRPSIRNTIHVSQLSLISVIKLFLHHQCSS